MEYNSSRELLKISEYGRNIQKMVNFAFQIADKTERSRFAELIVKVMDQMSRGDKEEGSMDETLWNHLYYISGYKLDVDSPYPLVKRKSLLGDVVKPSYGKNKIRYRIYGSNIEKMILEAIKMENGKEKDVLITTIANQLKRMYISWNHGSVSDELIKEHLKEISEDNLELGENVKLVTPTDIYVQSKNKKSSKTQRTQRKQYSRTPQRRGRKSY